MCKLSPSSVFIKGIGKAGTQNCSVQVWRFSQEQMNCIRLTWKLEFSFCQVKFSPRSSSCQVQLMQQNISLLCLCEASLVLSASRADFQWIPASSLAFHGRLASALIQTSNCPFWSYSILTTISWADQYLPSRTAMPSIGWLKFPNS